MNENYDVSSYVKIKKSKPHKIKIELIEDPQPQVPFKPVYYINTIEELEKEIGKKEVK